MFLSKSSTLCVLSLFIMSCNGQEIEKKLKVLTPAELQKIETKYDKAWICFNEDNSLKLPEPDVVYLKELDKRQLIETYCSSISLVKDYGERLNLLKEFKIDWMLRFGYNPFLPSVHMNDNAPMPWSTYVQKGFPYAVVLGLASYFLKMLIEKK